MFQMPSFQSCTVKRALIEQTLNMKKSRTPFHPFSLTVRFLQHTQLFRCERRQEAHRLGAAALHYCCLMLASGLRRIKTPSAPTPASCTVFSF